MFSYFATRSSSLFFQALGISALLFRAAAQAPLTINTVIDPSTLRTTSWLNSPLGLAVDSHGNAYVADTLNNRVLKAASDGTISTLAGNGSSGFSGDNGPAALAQLSGPVGLAVNTAGDVFITDNGNRRIRRVNQAGIITTVAGNGQPWVSYPGDGQVPATQMAVQTSSIAIDAAGSIYFPIDIADRVLKVSLTGVVSTVAGGGGRGDPTDGQQAVMAPLSAPLAVATDAAGDVFLSDVTAIYKITPDGVIRKVQGSPQASVYHMSADPVRGVCYSAFQAVKCITGSGTVNTIAVSPSTPGELAADNQGNLFFLEPDINRVRKVDANGVVSVALDAGVSVTFQLLRHLAVDSANNVYLADPATHTVWRVTPGGNSSIVAGNGVAAFGGDGEVATSSSLWQPIGICVDKTGKLYIADQGSHRIRVVGTDGIIRTLAGSGILGFSGDGGDAKSAALNYPEAVAVDAAGNVFIADRYNNRIRQVTPNGIISTVAGSGPAIGQGIGGSGGDGGPASAAQVYGPIALTTDVAGYVYFIETNGRVRRFKPGGNIAPVAGPGNYQSGDGGPATLAGLSPTGIAIDASGNIYLADGNRIRRIDPSGTITTAAGTGVAGFSGDGGPATAAQVNNLRGIALDAAGNLYMADGSNNRVRRVVAGTACSVTLSANTRALDAGPWNGSFSVQITPASCGYTAVSDSNWLHVNGGSAGTGSGTVQYSVDSNPATTARPGTIAISTAGATAAFHLYQSGTPCQFTLPPLYSSDFWAHADQFALLNEVPAGCAAWVATTDSTWLTITNQNSGLGFGYTFGNNTTSQQRSAVISINNQTHTVVQDPSPVVLLGRTPGSALCPAATFNWSSSSSITNVFYQVGTSVGGSELASGFSRTSASVSNIPCGRTIYVRLWYQASGIWQGLPVETVYPAAGATKASMTSPTPNSTLVGTSVNFMWDGGVGASAYWLDVGTIQGQGNIFGNNVGLVTSQNVSGIPANGATIYVRLWTLLNGVWQVSDYSYSAAPAGNLKATITSPAPGSTLTGSTVTFLWSAGAGASAYWLDVGTAQGQGTIFGQNVGLNTSQTVNGIPGNGGTIYVRLWTQLNGVWQFNDYTYTAPVGVGGTKATMTTPVPGSTLSGASVAFSWNPGAGASAYWLDVGTAQGQGNIFGQNVALATSQTISGIPNTGGTIYVRLWTQLSGVWQVNDYTYTAPSAGGFKASMALPAPGATLSGSVVSFSWNSGSQAAAYWLDVGTVQGHGDIFAKNTALVTNQTVTNIPTGGETIYVRLWTQINGVWQYNDYTYTAATTSTKAILTSPAPGSTLSGGTVTFTWSAGAAATAYWLDVGTAQGQGTIFGQNVALATSQAVSGIPTNGSTIYVRLWTQISGVWQNNDYTYTAAGSLSSKAVMTSPAPGSVLTGATINFTWSGVAGAAAYWLDVGTLQGQGTIFGSNVALVTSRSVSGIPTTGGTIYVRLWTQINGIWQFNDYTYTAANLGSLATMSTPAPGSMLNGGTVTFSWNPGAAATAYWLDVGTVQGQGTIFGNNVGLVTSQSVTGIPTNGGTIYVRLWTQISGAWQFNDYVYTAFH